MYGLEKVLYLEEVDAKIKLQEDEGDAEWECIDTNEQEEAVDKRRNVLSCGGQEVEVITSNISWIEKLHLLLLKLRTSGLTNNRGIASIKWNKKADEKGNGDGHLKKLIEDEGHHGICGLFILFFFWIMVDLASEDEVDAKVNAQ